jgi:hypothetical protein
MTLQLSSYSPQPRELYSPPPRWDPNDPVPTEEDSSASVEVPYKSETYTPPLPEPRFVDRGPTVTISWPTPAPDRTREPESSPRSRIRSFLCHDQVIGVSLTIGSVITIAIDAAVIFRIEPFTTALPAGVVVAVAALALFGIGLYFMARTGD